MASPGLAGEGEYVGWAWGEKVAPSPGLGSFGEQGGLFWKGMDTAGKQGRIPAPHGPGVEKCVSISSKVGGFPKPEGMQPLCVGQEEAAADSVPRGN